MHKFFTNILAPKITKQKYNWTKLCKALLYEKHKHRMLMKSTPGTSLAIGSQSVILNILPPTGKKVHLGFFGIMSTSILGNGAVILLLPRKI
jgi:hypothetical protein